LFHFDVFLVDYMGIFGAHIVVAIAIKNKGLSARVRRHRCQRRLPGAMRAFTAGRQHLAASKMRAKSSTNGN
jgi:hypothetical protein